MDKVSSYLLYFLVFLFLSSNSVFSQNFSLEQIPTEANLNSANNVGQGLSMTLFNDQPYFSAYSTEGKLVFIEEINDEWVFEFLTDNIIQGIFHDDKYETSLIFINNEPVIFYYDGVVRKLKYTFRNNSIWNYAEVDNLNEDDIGGFVEAIPLSSGGIRLCYQDNTSSNLKIAEGEIGGIFTSELVDIEGGSWCSFLSENTVLYSADGIIKRADYSNNTWSLSAIGINGYQPSGGINSNGSIQIYSSKTKASWGNNGISDTSLNTFYQAFEGFPSIGSSDAGAYPSYLSDVGYAFRYLRYSALFGSASYVRAFLKEPDGIYSYAINVNDGCLGEIRSVKLLQSSNGDKFIAFSYYCSNFNKQVIKLAFKAGPEQDEEEPEEEMPEEEIPKEEDESGDEEEGDDEEEEDDESGDDELDEGDGSDNNGDDSEEIPNDNENLISVERVRTKNKVNYSLDLSISSNNNCNLYFESSNRKFRRVISSKLLKSVITNGESLTYSLNLRNKYKASAFIRFSLVCNAHQEVKSRVFRERARVRRRNRRFNRRVPKKRKRNRRFIKKLAKRIG